MTCRGFTNLIPAIRYSVITFTKFMNKSCFNSLKTSSGLCRFVLLKERNMLMTTEEECNSRCEIFANPERIDKVRESMHNLEEVIMERNRAYHLLETGETGERPCRLGYSRFGLKTFFRLNEHLEPRKIKAMYYNEEETKLFLSLYREKMFVKKQKERRRRQRHVYGLLRNFPNIDIQHLKELYPEMNIDKMKLEKRARGSGDLLL